MQIVSNGAALLCTRGKSDKPCRLPVFAGMIDQNLSASSLETAFPLQGQVITWTRKLEQWRNGLFEAKSFQAGAGNANLD
jgi:hypothetical protein